jgi:hypothetical protein
LKSRQDKPGANLFISIDPAYNSNGIHVFAFLPQVEQEARTTLTTLLPFLKHCHPDKHTELHSFFTIETVERTSTWTWDANTDSITSANDTYLSQLTTENGDDAEYFGLDFSNDIDIITSPISEQEKIKSQRRYNQEDKDSVGTLTSGANPELITGQITPATTFVASSHASISNDTSSSFATHMDLMERRFTALEAILQQLMLRSSPTDHLPLAPSNPLQPAPNSTNVTEPPNEATRWMGALS